MFAAANDSGLKVRRGEFESWHPDQSQSKLPPIYLWIGGSFDCLLALFELE